VIFVYSWRANLGILTTGVDNLTIDMSRLTPHRAGIGHGWLLAAKWQDFELQHNAHPWDALIALTDSLRWVHRARRPNDHIKRLHGQRNFEGARASIGPLSSSQAACLPTPRHDRKVDQDIQIRRLRTSNGGLSRLTITNCS